MSSAFNLAQRFHTKLVTDSNQNDGWRVLKCQLAPKLYSALSVQVLTLVSVFTSVRRTILQ